MLRDNECESDSDREEVELLKLCRESESEEEATGEPGPRAEWRPACGDCVGELNTL